MFISGGHDLVFYDANTYKVIHRYSPKKGSKIIQASWSRDNNFLVYLAEDTKPIILACRDRDKIRSIVEVNLETPFSSVTFPRTTKKILGIGTRTGELFIYNTKTCTKMPSNYEPFPDAVRLVDYNCDDKVIAGASNMCVRIYDTVRGKYPEMSRALGSDCTAMRFHPYHAHTLAVATADGTVQCLDVTTNSAVYEMQCHKEPIAALAFSHRINSKCLITVSTDNKYAIHSIMDKNVVQCGHLPHGLTALDISDDRNSMLIGTEFGKIYQYDLRHFLTPVTSFKAHKSSILCLRYTNDLISGDGIVCCGGGTIGSAAGMAAREGDTINVGSNLSCSAGVDKYLIPGRSSSVHLMNNTILLPGATCAAASATSNLIESIQDQILRDVGADMLELSAVMTSQMANLQQFIKQEVDKVDAQNHDKWELLIAAAASGGDSCVGGGKSCYSSGQGGGGSVIDQRLQDGNNEPGSGDVVHRGGPGGGSQLRSD